MAVVVVVDDERSVQALLREVLEGLGHQVHTAGDGVTGLALIEQHRPALVVSDVMMPVMDGYRLVLSIRMHPDLGRTKIILMSAAPLQHNETGQADAYLAKPYDLDDLERVVTELLARYEHDAPA